jgi:toxin ParE1/3/4
MPHRPAAIVPATITVPATTVTVPICLSCAASVARDLAAIRRHLIRSYMAFGETRDVAADRADARLRGAFDYMRTFTTHPYRGTVHPELKPGVRYITDRNFDFFFEID